MDYIKEWGGKEENVVLKLKIGKINGEKYRIVHKTSTIKKIAVDNKKIPRKRWGISCE